MLCRTLRNVSAGHWALAGILSLAMVWGTAAPARNSVQDDEHTSIGIRAPQFPLAALEITSNVRLEKLGKSVRVTFHKPERSARLSSNERVCGVRFRPKGCPASPLLPRRSVPPRRVTPRDPNDVGDPFLASLALS
jgi:hypothetical protein